MNSVERSLMSSTDIRRAQISEPGSHRSSWCFAATTVREPDVTIEPVLRQFGLTMTEATPLGGNVTRGWRVMTQDGVFVLREHPRDHEPLVRTRHAVLRFLEDRFPHAPRVRAGSDSVAVAGGQLYEVLTYLPGASAVTPDQFDFEDDELVASAGALLGRMHRVLRSYRPPPTARWPAAPEASRLADALARLARRPAAEVARRALPIFLRFLVPPADDRTPRHVVHNDFAWYNCTRLGRRIDGIFDWDAASVATELRDVGYAVYAFAPIGPQSAPGQTETRIGALLGGYADALGESLAASRAQLLDMVAHRVAQAGAGLLVRADQGEQRDPDPRPCDRLRAVAGVVWDRRGGAARRCAAMITDIAVRDAGSKGRGVFALRAFRKSDRSRWTHCGSGSWPAMRIRWIRGRQRHKRSSRSLTSAGAMARMYMPRRASRS